MQRDVPRDERKMEKQLGSEAGTYINVRKRIGDIHHASSPSDKANKVITRSLQVDVQCFIERS